MDWPGGFYATTTMAGSRPGSVIAGTWAAIVSIGREQYIANTQTILEAAAVYTANSYLCICKLQYILNTYDVSKGHALRRTPSHHAGAHFMHWRGAQLFLYLGSVSSSGGAKPGMQEEWCMLISVSPHHACMHRVCVACSAPQPPTLKK